MAKLSADIGKTIKQNTVKGVTSALFGSGALGKAIASKFEDKEEKDTRVAQALTRQNQLFKDNNVTLTRIEKLAGNIAQNIGNIAEVMGAQLKKTEENQRLQQENLSRKQAASEENQTEAQKIQGPAPTGSAPKEKEQTQKDKLVESVSNTKKLIGALLKKFALVGGGLLLAGGAAMAASSFINSDSASSDQSTTDSEDQQPQEQTQKVSTSDTTEQPQEQTQKVSTTDATEDNTPNPEDFLRRMGGDKVAKEMAPFLGAKDINSFAAAAQQHAAANPPPAPTPTPAAPPPSVAATTMSRGDQEAKQLEEHFNKPENSADNDQLSVLQDRIGSINKAISSTKALIRSSTTDEERKKHEDILQNQLEPGLAATKAQKKAILDKGRAAAGITSNPASSAMSGLSESPNATQQKTMPSSGAEVNTSSVSVAAASEQSAPGEQVINTTTNNSSSGSSEITQIPSPIANRGSLDVGVTFDAGM